MKKIIALLLVLVMVLGLVACGSKEAPKTEEKKEETSAPAKTEEKKEESKTEEKPETTEVSDTLNIALSMDKGSLAPNWNSSEQGIIIYDTLYTLGGTPVLATEWEMTDDTHMLLKIREGVVDHAGNPFTAHDVIHSINYGSTDFVTSMYLPAIDYEKSKAIDDYTVELVYTAPNVDQEYLLAHVPMHTKAAMDASPDGMITTPVGTGAYKLVEYIPNSIIKLEANENYWGEVHYKYVNCYIITEAAQRAIALESGQVDYAVDITASDYLRLKDAGEYNVGTLPSGNTYCLYFNCSEYSVAHSKEFRQAIAYAVDNAAISQVVFKGLDPVATFTYRAECAGADAAAWCPEYYPVNAEKAKDLLAQAGVAEGTNLVIGTMTDDIYIATAEVVQGMLMSLGFNVEIQSFEAATWEEIQTHPDNGIDIYVTSVGCPDGYYGNSVYSKLVLSKAMYYENPEMLTLLDQSRSITNTEKQLEINKQIHDILFEDVPFYNLTERMDYVAYNNKVTGVDEMVSHDRIMPLYRYLHP